MKNYLAKAAYFTNKFDLDRAATKHRKAHWKKMNDTDRLVLDVIRQHSVKYGAAHLKYHTIAGIIDKSHSTVRRIIRKLVKLNIVEKTHFVRPIMNGLGANIYAIKPFEEETPAVKKEEQVEIPEEVKEIVLFERNEQSQEKVKTTEKAVVVEEATTQTFYERIQAFLQSTLGQANLARNIYGVFQKVTIPLLKFSVHAHRLQEFEQIGVRALHVAIQETKKKKIRNLPGYFSGVFKNMVSNMLEEEIFLLHAPCEPIEFVFFGMDE